MLPARLVERVASASHRFACACFPLLQSWEALPPERRGYQLDLAARGLGALTPADVATLVERLLPDYALMPRTPELRLLAEMQEAARSDAGTLHDARRRYRALLDVGAWQLRRRLAAPAQCPLPLPSESLSDQASTMPETTNTQWMITSQ